MTKLTQTPAKMPTFVIPNDLPPQQAKLMRDIVETLEKRLGRIGDPRDRAVTLRELIESGIAEQLKVTPFDPNVPTTPDFGAPTAGGSTTRPPQPTGFTATAGYSQALLFWDLPDYDYYSHTEVWRHTSDVIGDALLIGVSNGTSYVDPIGGGLTRYYWVRHVSTSGFYSEWYSSSGASVTTPSDVDHLLTDLAGAITKTELVASLTSEIETSTTDISNLHGQYTVKINANGRVAGFGLSNTDEEYDGGIHSDFIVLSDRFSIVNQNDNGDLIVPFVVTTATTLNGESVAAGVYIDQAFIKNGAIDTVKIGDAAIDTAKIANLAVSTAKVDDAAITNAKIANLAVDTAQIAAAAITSAQIDDLAVSTIKVAGNAISDAAYSATSSATSLTITHDARAGTVMLWAIFYPTSTSTYTYYLKRDTTTLQSISLNSTIPVVMMDVDNPPSSTDYDYKAEAGVSCNRIELLVFEVVK